MLRTLSGINIYKLIWVCEKNTKKESSPSRERECCLPGKRNRSRPIPRNSWCKKSEKRSQLIGMDGETLRTERCVDLYSVCYQLNLCHNNYL